MVGVFAPQWTVPVAETLKRLGSDRVWVAHGDGYDEITTTGETRITELVDGEVRTFAVSPENVGLGRYRKEDLRGADAAFNARALRGVLEGRKGAYRDTVLMNAGAGLVVAGVVNDLASGIRAAQDAIDDGRALAKLEVMRAATARLAGS
jgi:anthranilate phosphoribosyltransferase